MKEEKRKIAITVENIEGECPLYEEGDEIMLENFYIKNEKSEKICIHALSGMNTFLTAFSHGISAQELGLGKEDEKAFITCPDPGPPCTDGGNVLFRLERIVDRN